MWVSLTALDILSVKPEWQGRGIGCLLVDWGTTIADRLGFIVKIIFSPFSHGIAADSFRVSRLWLKAPTDQSNSTRGLASSINSHTRQIYLENLHRGASSLCIGWYDRQRTIKAQTILTFQQE